MTNQNDCSCEMAKINQCTPLNSCDQITYVDKENPKNKFLENSFSQQNGIFCKFIFIKI